MIVGTGRLVLEKTAKPPFSPNWGQPPRHREPSRRRERQTGASADDRPGVDRDPAVGVVLVRDSRTQEVGKIDLPCDKQVVDNYLAMPAVVLREAITVTQAICVHRAGIAHPGDQALEDIEEIDGLPLPP